MMRIAVTGPESTGKSWLCEALSEHYQAIAVPEYAREYLDALERPYTMEDVLAIARKQQEMISQAMGIKGSRMMIADTEMLVISIWLDHKYGTRDPWVEEMLKQQPFDLYLLCDIDLPWEEDPLREHPHLRQYFFDLYRSKLETFGFPYAVVKGSGDDRLLSAIQAIASHG